MKAALGVLVMLLLACDKKPPAPTAGSNAPAGSNAVAMPPPPPVVDAAVVVAPPDASMVESKYGYCEATLTGSDGLSMRVPFNPDASWVRSDYWLSKELKAKHAVLDKDLAKQGMKTEDVEMPIRVSCDDPLGSKLSLDFETAKLAKLKDLPEHAADFPMMYKDGAEQKPNEIRLEVLLPGKNYGDSTRTFRGISGALHVTAFKQGVFEATLDIDIATGRPPIEKGHLTGKIVFHCADYDVCGE